MKKKIVLLCVFVLSLFALMVIPSFAEEVKPKEIVLSYYKGYNSVKDIIQAEANVDTDGDGVLDGYKEKLKENAYNEVKDGKKFYGWFTDDGILHAPNSEVIFTKDTRLYEAIGVEADTFAGKGGYIKLTKDLTFTEQVHFAEWGILILDLNGHTITSTSEKFTYAKRAGLIIIGEGTINHTGSESFFEAERHGHNNDDYTQRLWVGKNVKINTNSPLMTTKNSLSPAAGVPTIRIYGTIKAKTLAIMRGTTDASVDIYESANLTITGTSLYEDIGTLDDRTLVHLTIHGGKFNLPSENDGFINFIENYDKELHDFEIYGGSFNRDVQKLISTDFRCEDKNNDGYFDVVPNPCLSGAAPDGKHDYVMESLTVTCDEDGTISYECLYCGDYYTIGRDALGHTISSTTIQEPKNTVKETLPGVVENYCSRCTQTYISYTYPDPAEAYITIKVNQNGLTETLRVKGKVLFGFKQDGKLEGKTCLTSYAVSRFEHTYTDGTRKEFKKEDIYYIEIPLGTTAIGGGVYDYTKTPLGAFYDQNTIEEIVIPASVIDIQSHAFREMDRLKSVKGMEFDTQSGKMVEVSALKNVTGEIQEGAFYQDELSRLSFDNLEINATLVGENAFRNCPIKTVRFGENVNFIQKNAFYYDAKLLVGPVEIKEVFFDSFTQESHPNMDGVSVESAHNYSALLKKKSDGSELQCDLIKSAPIYYNHKYDTVIHKPTCLSVGYTGHECVRCGYGTKDNFVSNEGIEHEWTFDESATVPSTCTTQGFTAEMCHKCGSKRASDYLPLDPNNHTYTQKAPEENSCTKYFWKYLIVCECGKELKNSYLSGVTQQPLNPGHENKSGEYFDTIEYVKQTCGTDGYKEIKCKYCSYKEREEYDATGNHKLAQDTANTIKPTCASSGTNAFFCSNGCGHTETSYVPPLKGAEAEPYHVYGEWVVIQAPTYEITGFRQTLCTLCSTPKTEIMPTLVKETFGDKLANALWSTPLKKGITITVIVVIVLGILGLTIYFTLFRKSGLGRKFKYGFEKTAEEKMTKKEQRKWKKRIKKVKKK